jgi:toxin CcdB
MAQFYLYKNENRSSNKTYPYFIDVQNDLLSDLNSRLVIPLSSYDALSKTDAKRLCPVIHLDEGDFVLLTHQMTSVPKSILKNKVVSLEDLRDEILAAIDMLISGI